MSRKWSKLVPVVLLALAGIMMLSYGCPLAENKDRAGVVVGSSAAAPENLFGAKPLSDEEYQKLPAISVWGIAPGEELAVSATLSSWSTLSPSGDLRTNVPTPGNQGSQGSCVAWAVGYALKSCQEQVERKWGLNTDGHLFSPAYIYNQRQNQGSDSGMSIPNALELLKSQGCATLATMPYDPTDCETQPSLPASEEAPTYKIVSYNRVEAADLNGIKTLLSQGNPIVIIISVGSNMWPNIISPCIYSSLGNMIKPPGASVPGYYNHSVTLVGYDDNKGANGAFEFINSWGTGFGDHGYAWIDYNFFFQVCTFGSHYEIYYAQDFIETTITGSIYVSSDPTGAEVYLNGSYAGIAPLTIPAVPVGSHTVKVTKDGYKTQEIVATVTENQTTQMSITLESESVSTPGQPSGPTSGITGTSYTYSTGGSSCNLGHSLEYRFDWGDGTPYSTWSSSTNALHSWVVTGTYTVKAQARCATHTSVVSNWSCGLSVAIVVRPPIPIYPAYDVNQDGMVEMMDFFILADAFGSHPGDSNWNPAADVNKDGMVEMMDYKVVSDHFGETCPIIGYK